MLGKVCDPLSSIIDAACLPLEEVFLECHNEVAFSDNFQPELARTAKKLAIGNHYIEIEWLPVLQSLQNQYVTWKTLYQQVPAADLIELIRSWLLEEKRIGTTFTFYEQKQHTAIEFFEAAEQQFPGSYRKDRCVTIPITPFSKIRVSRDLDTKTLEMKVLNNENEDVNVVTKNLCSCSIN